MYKIKQTPEDFIVKEIPNYNLEKGPYAYFWMTKKNYNTMDAVRRIANSLHIELKNMGFAGSKDKKAITKQVISIKNIKKEKIESLTYPNIKLEYIGQGAKPMSLGDLKGNEFVIVVRDIDSDNIKTREMIPNLYGPQRFSKDNVEIGRSIIKRDFKKALELINQEEVQERLKEYPGDYIGALRKLPIKIRKLYVHAYQSKLWNETAEEYIKLGNHKNRKIPIVGFGTEIEDLDADLKKIIENILEREKITTRDFILQAIKEISAEGGERDLLLFPKNIEIEIKGKKAIISFSLPKGSYATVVIEKLFN